MNYNLKEKLVTAIIDDKVISDLVKMKSDIIGRSIPTLVLDVKTLSVTECIDVNTDELKQIDDAIKHRVAQIKSYFER